MDNRIFNVRNGGLILKICLKLNFCLKLILLINVIVYYMCDMEIGVK